MDWLAFVSRSSTTWLDSVGLCELAQEPLIHVEIPNLGSIHMFTKNHPAMIARGINRSLMVSTPRNIEEWRYVNSKKTSGLSSRDLASETGFRRTS